MSLLLLYCPFAHFYIPDLIEQNLYFAMVSALKENRHLCVSLVILGANKLFDRDRIFGKT